MVHHGASLRDHIVMLDPLPLRRSAAPAGDDSGRTALSGRRFRLSLSTGQDALSLSLLRIG